ncbi:MAG: hypothetical protein DMG56_04645 [Acidobacteria bacterium]|nr:MAG: hypothetical protein DMG56_04645 [Acidobacteriota bacterium]
MKHTPLKKTWQTLPAPYRRYPAARADPGFQRRSGFAGHPVPFLKQRGLTARQLLAPAARKKFETKFIIVTKSGNPTCCSEPYVQRAGAGSMEAFLYAILADGSRLIRDAEFYAQQGLDAFLDLDAVQLLDAHHQ